MKINATCKRLLLSSHSKLKNVNHYITLMSGLALFAISLPTNAKDTLNQTTSSPQSLASVCKTSIKQVVVKSGDNLSVIFNQMGLSANNLHQVLQSNGDVKPLRTLKPGKTLRFCLNHADQNTILKGLSLNMSPTQTLLITQNGTGHYSTTVNTLPVETRREQVSGIINDSLSMATKKAGLPYNITSQFTKIFGWKVNFSRELRKGDSFKVIYKTSYIGGKKLKNNEIIAAQLTNRGHVYQAISYTTPNGITNFYTPQGKSLRKSFLRAPLHYTRVSSKFNLHRMHPIFHRIIPHKGVDLAAPIGTPVHASGDGHVIFVGREHGYGRVIKLAHGSMYKTVYAHLSAYAKGLKQGQHVTEGQLIGYVGESGFATGPHLHYEFRINNIPKNPMTVTLPQAAPLNKLYLADFEKKAEPLLASLEAQQAPLLAFNHPQ